MWCMHVPNRVPEVQSSSVAIGQDGILDRIGIDRSLQPRNNRRRKTSDQYRHQIANEDGLHANYITEDHNKGDVNKEILENVVACILHRI